MAGKREEIEPNPGDKRYVRRNDKGEFTTDQVDESKSLAADNNQKAKTDVKPGHGDQGDHKTKK